jgi:ribosomal protein S3AE
MLQTYNNNNISNLKSVSQKIDAEMKVYLVDGKTLDTFVVAVTTKQKFNQIIDSSPFGYQQTFVL